MRTSQKDFILFYISQACVYSVSFVVSIISARLYGSLAVEDSAATLPYGLFQGLMLVTIIAAAPLTARYGAKRYLIGGSVAGLAGWGIVLLSVLSAAPTLTLVGFGLLGLGIGTTFIIRFESVRGLETAERASRMAWMISSGLMAAFVAPGIGSLTGSQDGSLPSFETAILLVIGLQAIMLVCHLALDREEDREVEAAAFRWGFGQLVDGWATTQGILATIIGFGCMAALMVTAPLHMDMSAHGVADIAYVYNGHIVAMFAPAFLAVPIARLVGPRSIILLGIALNLIAIIVGLSGLDFHNFFILMALDGAGWALMIIGATTLIAAEGRAVQSLYNLSSIGASAFFGAGIGLIYDSLGWFVVLNILGVCFFLTALFIGATARRTRPA